MLVLIFFFKLMVGGCGRGAGGGREAMNIFETVLGDHGSFNGWSSVFSVQVHKPDSCG